MDKKSIIIFLNGVGSVGKTSIAKELQEIFKKPYLHIGIDHFIEMLPKKYLSKGRKANEGIKFIQRKTQSNFEVEIKLGKIGRKIFPAMRQAMLVLAKSGFNLIIDEVVIGDEFKEYKGLFKNFHFISIGVFAPLEIIEKREKQRKDRTLGLARGHFDLVHKGKIYDLKIDSSKASPRECAEQIKKFMKNRKLSE